MLQDIQIGLDHYYYQLPDDMAEAAFKSAAFSFVASILFSGRVEVGQTTALLAATVSLVSGLTMPLFRKFLADGRGNLPWSSFAVSQMINLGITQALVNSLTYYYVNMVSSLFMTVFLTGWMNHFADHPTHACPTYVLV